MKYQISLVEHIFLVVPLVCLLLGVLYQNEHLAMLSLMFLLVVIAFIGCRVRDISSEWWEIGACQWCGRVIPEEDLTNERIRTNGGLLMCPHCGEFTKARNERAEEKNYGR